MIIDGKRIAKEILDDLKIKIAALKVKPTLAVILIGENPASKIYVEKKEQTCKTVGINSISLKLKTSTAEIDLLNEITRLNKDPNITSILIQLPLPSHINQEKILEAVAPEKDVDGFHPYNMGKLLLGYEDCRVPCTPLGIHELLIRSNIELEGKHVLIIGRSNIVGKPLAALLIQKRKGLNATVTIAHSKTHNLKSLAYSADILVAAIGKASFVTKDMVKKGAVVIDVGTNRIDGTVVGDVDFKEVSKIASYITPVPGGVGPMTIAMLLKNTYLSYMKVR